MTDCIKLLFSSVGDFMTMLSNFTFDLFGFSVDLLSVFLAFIFVNIMFRAIRSVLEISSSELTTESIKHGIHTARKFAKGDKKVSKGESRRIHAQRGTENFEHKNNSYESRWI